MVPKLPPGADEIEIVYPVIDVEKPYNIGLRTVLLEPLTGQQ
jgi:hypothetical protein